MAQGILICLLGIDGSGKSTQAQRLVAQLNAMGYTATYVWGGRRGLLTASLVRCGKVYLSAPAQPVASSMTTNPEYRAYVRGTQQLFKRGGLRDLWRQITLMEHLLEIWWYVARPLAQGRIVVCDRYLYDSLVNQAVLFDSAPVEIYRQLDHPLLSLVPRPALGFWLDTPPEVALRRKTDVYDIQQLELRAPLYGRIASVLGFQPLDSTLPAARLGDVIWSSVSLHLGYSRMPAFEHLS
jgi:dTMP kinase